MQKNRIGYTTGTCAQAAAKAACFMLTTKQLLKKIEVETPSGRKFILGLIEPRIKTNFASCGVIKDSGDDPDVTNGAKVYAKARFSQNKGITLKGGEGIGKVTKPGLAVKVGEWAINPVPRKMILKEVSKFLPKEKGIEITLSVQDGAKLAKRTFNPNLGIIGGISIIGTSGIVQPKSTDAYKASLALQLNVLKAQGIKKVVLVLGYVGEKYCRLQIADCRLKNTRKNKSAISNLQSTIKIGDHVGFMLKQCAQKKMKEVFLIGHIGKLIKVANGQLNTHIKFGDNRIKTIANFAKACGANKETLKNILKQRSAESTTSILKHSRLEKVFNMIAKNAVDNLNKLTNNGLKINCIVLSLNAEVLGSYPKLPDFQCGFGTRSFYE